MGLYPQPNKWQCGPFALKYALIMLGKIVDEKEVSRIARSHWHAGTDEVKMRRAARAYQCDLKIIRRTNSLRAKRELLKALKAGHPSLLCIDNWDHWITVVGAEKGKIVTVNSSEAPVVCVDTWRSLRKRWMYVTEDPDDPTQRRHLYDLHVIVPQFRVRTKAHFSLKQARYLRRPENRDFATHWDEYFTNLTKICVPRTPRTEKVIAMGEFLRRHGTMIQNQIAMWHGGVRRDQVRRMLKNMQFVTDTYDLVIRVDDEKRSIAAVTANLSLWAAGRFGVEPMYGKQS